MKLEYAKNCIVEELKAVCSNPVPLKSVYMGSGGNQPCPPTTQHSSFNVYGDITRVAIVNTDCITEYCKIVCARCATITGVYSKLEVS